MSRPELEKDLREIEATYEPRIQMLREMLEDEVFRKLECWEYLLKLEEEMKKTLNKRNPYHAHPLMRKCSTHGKSKKALRRSAKMSLRKEI